jgi:hypothetical protein
LVLVLQALNLKSPAAGLNTASACRKMTATLGGTGTGGRRGGGGGGERHCFPRGCLGLHGRVPPNVSEETEGGGGRRVVGVAAAVTSSAGSAVATSSEGDVKGTCKLSAADPAMMASARLAFMMSESSEGPDREEEAAAAMSSGMGPAWAAATAMKGWFLQYVKEGGGVQVPQKIYLTCRVDSRCQTHSCLLRG